MKKQLGFHFVAFTAIVSLTIFASVVINVRGASASASLFYLHGTGASNNPPTLFMDTTAPLSSSAKYKDSSPVAFAGGNPWQSVGTWTTAASATNGHLSSLGNAEVWVGLRNSDDQGTQFDIRTELLKNGAVVAFGQARCITGIVRNASSAKRIVVPFNSVPPTTLNGSSDILALRVLTRVGTNADDTKCVGHSNATGLRSYFDGAGQAASLQAGFSTSPTPPRIYVTNTNSSANNVTVIDATTDAVLSVIPVGNQPRGIAVSAITHRAYVVNTYGSQSVSVIDTDTDAVIGTIALGPTIAFNAALSTDGSRLYLSGYTASDDSLGANLTVIDTAAATVIHTVQGFRSAASLVVSPDGSKVYYADSNCCDLPHPNGFVHVIDTTTYAVSNIEVGPFPVGADISPDGLRLYVANGAGDSVSVIDTITSAAVATLATPPVPNGVTINATGTRAYITVSSGSVMVIDTATNTTLATVSVTGNLTYSALSADGGKLFIAGNDANLVTVMSTATNAITNVLTSGFSTPFAIAAMP